MLLYIRSNAIFCSVFQALVQGGLASLAKDADFVSATKREMAEAMHIPVTQMEGMAQGILNERSGSVASVKKRRPIPVPPVGPSAATQETVKPDPAVRRKRRPIPLIPSVQAQAEADSKV